MAISVLIPTKNEEKDLPGCIASVRWSDDIHVYDSGSTDRTRALAESLGAHVVQRPNVSGDSFFGGNEAEHKNWALKNIQFKYPWVLHIDADERVTPELAVSLKGCADAPGAAVAFRVQRRDFYRGRWLKHVQASPYFIRLFRPDRLRYERLVNPLSVVDGPVNDVNGFLDHFPFSKGMEHWLARHNAYSTYEARQILANRAARETFSLSKAIFEKDFSKRRFHQKELFYRLPMRPLLKFMIVYFGKRGFLDGGSGFAYACLQSIYEYFIVLKTREFEHSKDE